MDNNNNNNNNKSKQFQEEYSRGVKTWILNSSK